MLKRAFCSLAIMTALGIAVSLFIVACGTSDETTTSSSLASVDTDSATTAAGDSSVSTSVDSTEVGTSENIVVSGLVDYPMTFTALDMDYMDWVTITADDPELGSTEYQGVLLSDIFSYVGAQSAAKTVVITAADGSTSEVALADVTVDALLAVADDNALSTVMPGMADAAWVKDVVKMTFK